MTTEQRERLTQILNSLDEGGLIALANKGLVRRATKDYEAGGLTHEETDDAILIHGQGWTVTMPPEGPTKATDDTKATGITRQILAATIYLREQFQPESIPVETDTKSLEDALLSLSMDELQKWAGKNAFREAIHLVETHPEIDIETTQGWTLRLIKHEIEARILPGDWDGSTSKLLLNQMLTTSPKSQHKCWVVAAVLALQKHHGQSLDTPQSVAPADAGGAPRSREQVLHSTKSLLESMVSTGIAHPSQRLIERLQTLSVSATGVHLPRLSRLVRAISSEVSLILRRDAAADTARLLERIALTNALTLALLKGGDQPRIELAGRHRTEYDPVGDLMLAGVGAYPWSTASGFDGLTILFWEMKQKRFYTWSASRPIHNAAMLDPARTYERTVVWEGGGPPERLCRFFVLLRKARANPNQRLSGSQQSKVEMGELIDAQQVDFGDRAFVSWQALNEYAITTYPMGLLEKNPLDRIVVVKPTAWGERFFDELQQRLVWQIHDDQGATIELVLPWLGVNEEAIEFLEAVKPERERLMGTVARIHFHRGGLHLEPLSLLSQGTRNKDCILNPAFDRARIVSKQSNLLARLRKKYGRDRIPTTMTADEDLSDESESTGFGELLPDGLQRLLSEIESLLMRLSESGVGRLNETLQKQIEQFARSVERLGLSELSEALRAFESSDNPAHELLWNAYLCQLHRQSAGLTMISSLPA